MKIGIFFHSGVGNTEVIAKIYKQILVKKNVMVKLHSVEKIGDINLVFDYDLLIIGAPNYHGDISQVMQNFIRQLPNLLGKNCYLFVTCGLYPANCLHRFAKKLQKKAPTIIGGNWYKMPASDAALIFPRLKYFWQPRKNIYQKVVKDCNYLVNSKVSNYRKWQVKKFKLPALLNLPNELLGKKFKPLILINPNKCSKCQKCIINCPLNCFTQADLGTPVFNNTNCENCYRCVHHCPAAALSINRKQVKRLDKSFFNKLFQKIITNN